MCYIFLDAEDKPLNFERCKGEEVIVIRDSTTGLDWEVKSLDEEDFRYCNRKLNWFAFVENYIPKLNRMAYGGFSDWHAPSKD